MHMPSKFQCFSRNGGSSNSYSLRSNLSYFIPSLPQLYSFYKMDDLTKYPGSKSSSDKACEKLIIPKEEILDYEIPPDTFSSRNFEDNRASSSGSNLRSSFIGMGFRPSLVDKVIEEKGEDDVDLILETLFAYSAPQKSNSESSDSLDSLFDDNGVSSPLEIATLIQPKEEPEIASEINDGKRASLLMMNFSVNEVEFAIDKLGEDAPIDELVDFIVAAQIAERFVKDTDDTSRNDEEKNEDLNNETLFGTMDKTVRLLEMGFSENQVSWAIENFGSEAPISELADSIVKGRTPDKRRGKDKYHSTAANTNHLQTRKGCNPDSMGMQDVRRNPSYHSTAANINHSQTRTGCNPDSMGMQDVLRNPSYDVKTENEDFSVDAPQAVDMNSEEAYLGKRPKEEYIDDYSGAVPQFRHINHEENHKGKRPKQEYVDYSTSFLDPTWEEEKIDPNFSTMGMANGNTSKNGNRMACQSPYFLYGNVVNVGHESWEKVSSFLYGMEPEFVNTQFFSALSRREGYIHNLPTENRFHILPKPPMTIEDAIPQTKKWWPPWDTRKQLSRINSETSGISQLCDRLGRMLAESCGQLSFEHQKEILHHCRSLNLVWVGRYKLGAMQPEHLERILGYPVEHTQPGDSSLTERLESLRYCLQTDVLGYLLSVLKSLYPGGLTLLSIFSGIGGAEIALHRLGIRLRGVVSVETSGMKRRILKRWWQNTGQTGELLQIEDIQRLTSSKLESLFRKFGGFDLIICQNPSTSDSVGGLDSPFFYEFVRVLQRVRNMKEKKR
nr:probable inactive DNA (cytosine-5)-methyltransferase DRM3 isoform X2 [Ziziphus jujuba var. spinosa]